MLLLYDDPDLVRAVVDRVGQTIYDAFCVFCELESVFALWLGDDMGFKTATLLQPQHLRNYILPWHKRYAELAHRTGRLFLLHSCGHVEAIMPDLIEDVRIDAKHSFEDVIVPVEEFRQCWGTRVAVLGGVDVDLLSRGSADDIRRRTAQILGTMIWRGIWAREDARPTGRAGSRRRFCEGLNRTFWSWTCRVETYTGRHHATEQQQLTTRVFQD